MKKFLFEKRTIIGLILISLLFSNSYVIAKYTSSLRSTVTSADVAKWEVTRDYSDNASDNLYLIAGNDTSTQTYILKLSSTSDVSANYKVILSDVPDTMMVKIDNGSFVSPTNGTITFSSNSYTINVTDVDKNREHTLTFKVPIDVNFLNINTIAINLQFEQID